VVEIAIVTFPFSRREKDGVEKKASGLLGREGQKRERATARFFPLLGDFIIWLFVE